MNSRVDPPSAAAASDGKRLTPWVRVAAGVAAFAALVMSRTVAVPLFAAVLLALALSPLCHQLCRLHIPRGLASLLAVLILLTTLGTAIYQVRQPLVELLARGPDILRVVHHEVMDITDGQTRPSISTARTRTEEQQAVLTMLTPLATGFSRALLGAGTSIVLCFFLLTSGSGVGRAVLVAVRGKSERRAWLRVCSAIRQQASRYLYLVTVINVGFGFVTGALLWTLSVKDAAAYGVVAGLFNFVPIIGALITAALIFAGSFADHGLVSITFLPVAAFLLLHITESQFVTPQLLGRKLLLNPLVVILGLLVGATAWGIGGAFLAVPILTSLKIAADAHPGWRRWGQVLGRGAITDPAGPPQVVHSKPVIRA
ncbi:MAG: AI-2E family transporter [Steroidobacteraceae bacterium]